MDKRKRTAVQNPESVGGGLPVIPCAIPVTAQRVERAPDPAEVGQLERLLDAAIAAEVRTGQAIERLSAAFLEFRGVAAAAFAPAAAP